MVVVFLGFGAARVVLTVNAGNVSYPHTKHKRKM